jgi:hypothetical protein
MHRILIVTIAIVAAVLALVIVRGSPPRPLDAGAPEERFSAMRAREIQRAISVAPRPAGSRADAEARAKLAHALEGAGFRVEEQHTFACGRHSACAFVTNIVAVREGSDPNAPAVMIAAHHDSVPASPGASDDGAGAAAVVEAARAIGAGPDVRRTLVVLLTDGEEDGLLGAEAFAREHPLAKRVRAVVNVDARGSSGPSFMFETSANSAWLVSLYAKSVSRPATSSLFYEVYKRMPNDTDFTVFRRFAQGLSLANVGSIEHYHTSLDTIANADPGTLQHHGDQVLALARALADTDVDLDSPPPGEAVWFDVLSRFVARWPARATLPLAIVALVLVLFQALRLRALEVDRALAAWPASLAASLAGALLVGSILKAAGALPAPWIAHPLFAVVSMSSASIATGTAMTMLLVRGSEARVAWAGVWIAWALAAVGVAIVAPGAAWLFVVPALVAGLAAFVPHLGAASAIPVVAVALLWLPLVSPLYEALGMMAPPLVAVPSCFLAASIAPMVIDAKRRLLIVPTMTAVALMIGALVARPFDERVPQRVNVVTRQDEGDADARVYVNASWGAVAWGPEPAPMLAALGDRAGVRREYVLPWIASSPGVHVPRMDLASPEATDVTHTTDGANRVAHARLRSRRGASTLLLEVTDAARRGATVTANGAPSGMRGTVLALRGVPQEGVDVDITYQGDAPLDVVLYDSTSGAPMGSVAARAIAARPASAAPSQEGDVTVVSARLRL